MTYEKIVTVYDSMPLAEKAVSTLKAAGYKLDDISVVSKGTLASSGARDVEIREPGLWRRLFGTNVLDHEAGVYGRTVQSGGAIVSVRVPQSDVTRVMELLDTHNPASVPAAVSGSSRTVATDASASDVIRLAEEQLNIGKRLVQDGKTRIRRFVIEKPVETSVTLHEEHAEVLRRAVANPEFISDVDWTDKTIEVAESAERAVVSKSVRVVEEVVIRKAGSDHVETIRDKVRRQQVDVEHLDIEGKKKAA
jgi:uncharacterized protein (TIGR02271 family)